MKHLIALFLLALLGIGEARAITETAWHNGVSVVWRQDCVGSACAKPAAFADCKREADKHNGVHPQRTAHCIDSPANATSGQFLCRYSDGQSGVACYFTAYPYGSIGCPAGTVWDDTSKTCFDSQRCLAKNDSLGNAISVYDTDTHGCNDGCAMSMGTDYERDTFTAGSQTRTLFRGKMRFTGSSCATMPKKAPDTTPECINVEGQSVCKRNDGKMCQKAVSTGNYICWSPGETGQKSDGRDVHKRDPGNTPQPPAGLPSGDTLVPNGTPVTNTTTNNTTNQTTNTVTNTYVTQNGTNAGPGNSGVPNPGEGDGEGEGEEGEEGSASGGGNCDAPPVCSGDPIDCAQLDQMWRTRCQQKGDANGNGRPDWTELGTGEGDEGPGAGTGEEKANSWDFSGFLDQLDSSGFIGGSCAPLPQMDFGFATFDPNTIPAWCEALQAIGALFVFIAACNAIRILVS